MVRSILAALIVIGAHLIGSVSQANAQLVYMAPQQTVSYQEDGSGSHDLSVLVRDDSEVLLVTQGFSMGLRHDPAIAEAVEINYGEAMLDDSWGQPSFFGTNVFEDGWTCGVVYAHAGQWTYSFPTPEEVVVVTYTARAGAPFLQDSVGATTALSWSDTLGSPPVVNGMAVDGISVFPELEDGHLTFSPLAFVRGDMNGDNQIDLGDVFTAQDYAILGGPTPSCLAALDANADSGIDIADIVYILSYLFVGGAAPASPFPNCGPDAAGSELGCDAYACP